MSAGGELMGAFNALGLPPVADNVGALSLQLMRKATSLLRRTTWQSAQVSDLARQNGTGTRALDSKWTTVASPGEARKLGSGA